MTITIGRYRRFETILHALLDEKTADLAVSMAGLVLEKKIGSLAESYSENHTGTITDNVSQNENDLKAEVDSEALRRKSVRVLSRDLSVCLGMPPESLLSMLMRVNTKCQRQLGFMLVQSTSPSFTNEGVDAEFLDLPSWETHDEEETFTLSTEFSDILTGVAAPKHWMQTDPPVGLDCSSLNFVALVQDAARAGAGPFLLRQRQEQNYRRQLELIALADALLDGCGIPVYVATDFASSDKSGWKPVSSIIACLLAAALHLPTRGILLMPFAEQFAREPARSDDEDDLSNPSKKTAPLTFVMSPHADAVLSILPNLGQTAIVSVPFHGTLSSPHAVVFAGAGGPLRLGKSQGLGSLMDGFRNTDLSIETVERLLSLLGHADHARSLLTAARRITDAKGEYGVAYDNLVARLAASLAPVIETSSPSSFAKPKKADCFDYDLCFCEPALEPFLAKSGKLRAAGTKILLVGPPGTGKTALASQIGSAMGIDIREIRSGDLHGKFWGVTERLIRNTFLEAAADEVMLFIDEADAILADRSRDDSNKHLTVTATSEFLKFLDGHPLPVVAATNFLQDIDKAVIRRFDIIVHAKLLPKDRELLAWRKIIGLEPPSQFQPIGGTAVADYVLVKRRLDLLDEQDTGLALNILHEVRDARAGADGSKPSIGFLP